MLNAVVILFIKVYKKENIIKCKKVATNKEKVVKFTIIASHKCICQFLYSLHEISSLALRG